MIVIDINNNYIHKFIFVGKFECNKYILQIPEACVIVSVKEVIYQFKAQSYWVQQTQYDQFIVFTIAYGPHFALTRRENYASEKNVKNHNALHFHYHQGAHVFVFSHTQDVICNFRCNSKLFSIECMSFQDLPCVGSSHYSPRL